MKITQISSQFLSNIQTKHDLTIYLVNYAKQAFESSNKKCHCLRNKNYDSNLLTYFQEEADTLMILHAIDFTKGNPFDELIISALMLLKLCNQTRFLTGRGKHIREIEIGKPYGALGPKRAEELRHYLDFMYLLAVTRLVNSMENLNKVIGTALSKSMIQFLMHLSN